MIREIGEVTYNNELAQNFYEAEIISPEISKLCKPGQFVNILPSSNFKRIF